VRTVVVSPCGPSKFVKGYRPHRAFGWGRSTIPGRIVRAFCFFQAFRNHPLIRREDPGPSNWGRRHGPKGQKYFLNRGVHNSAHMTARRKEGDEEKKKKRDKGERGRKGGKGSTPTRVRLHGHCLDSAKGTAPSPQPKSYIKNCAFFRAPLPLPACRNWLIF